MGAPTALITLIIEGIFGAGDCSRLFLKPLVCLDSRSDIPR